MTVYNEVDYIDFAIRGCLPYVDHLVIVEGAYQETIALGKTPRSNDGTLDIIQKYTGDPKVYFIEANEHSDKDQRNIGLKKIKELNPDGYVCIIDGDEIYEPFRIELIKKYAIPGLVKANKKVKYFASMTFVNDFKHFTWQQFPRLFKITPKCHFVNDNQMSYEDGNENIIWCDRPIYDISSDKIRYFHYSFCKGKERFETKRKWWMNRGYGTNFDYGWNIDGNHQISDPKNHKILEYVGIHPEIMKHHSLYRLTYESV